MDLGTTRLRIRLIMSFAGVAGMLLAVAPISRVIAQTPPALSSNATVFATGLDHPRGLRFGPNGNLYVAEAGHGGTTLLPASLTRTSYGAACLKPGPEIASTGSGYSGRISMLDAKGQRTTVVDNLPSDNVFGNVVGPAAVEFLNGVLYSLLDSGCNFGNPDVPGGIIQVANDGSWSIYDLTTWTQQHPAAQPDPDDFVPEGSWYSLTQGGGKLWTVNPNGGQLVELTTNSATFRLVTDMSVGRGWTGPTPIVYRDGALYVATLGKFPQTDGQQTVYKITPDGTTTVYATGLTAATGLTFDAKGQLYALELFTGVGAPGPNAPGTGMVVRVTPGSAPTTVASGFTFPTAITAGPDGNLYVSNNGLGPTMGGQIVKVTP